MEFLLNIFKSIIKDQNKRQIIKKKLIKINILFFNLLHGFKFNFRINPYNSKKYHIRNKENIDIYSIPFFLKKNGTYFEAGALDGYFSSPTYYLCKKKGWKGILVEPLDMFNQELALRRPKDIIVNKVLTSEEKLKTNKFAKFLNLHHSSKIFLNYEELEEWDKSILKKDPKIEKTIICTTIDRVLEEKNITNLDLMALDLEGHELEALTGIDFNKTNIKYFLAETNKGRFEKIHSFLLNKKFNYLGNTNDKDSLFVNQNL